MPESTLYDILQVVPTAEPEVISAAHRRLALKYHPDVSPEPDAVERMKQINAAYEVLRDPARRREYDARLLRTATAPAQAGVAARAAPSDDWPAAGSSRVEPRPSRQVRRPVALPVSLGLLGTVGLIGGFLWLTIEVLPGEPRREAARVTPTAGGAATRPAATSAVATLESPARPAMATSVTPLSAATAVPTRTSSPTPEPAATVSLMAEAPTSAPPPTPVAPTRAQASPTCQSLPDSIQQGTEFDLVSLSQEQRQLPVVGNVVVVSGSVRNNCDLPRAAELTFLLLDERNQDVGSSARSLLLDALQPGETRAFRFEPARAPDGSRIEIRARPR